MFEKFAEPARQVVVSALAEAKGAGTSQISCEHLLIGVARTGSGPAHEALAAAGLSAARLRQLSQSPGRAEPLDADALAAVGIDLGSVIRAAEAAFGPGALDRAAPGHSSPGRGRARLTPDAKLAIGLALKSARHGRDRVITADHILIGLVDQGRNGATRILEQASVRPSDLRADTVRRMSAA